MAIDSQPGGILALAGVFIALCPIFAALRLYSRAASKKLRYGADDWMMLLGLVSLAADIAEGGQGRLKKTDLP